jgi:hypothetical protein
VCEEFEFRHTDQGRSKIEYISKEYIGVVELYAALNPSVRVVRQSASQAVGESAFWNDAKLKYVGLYTPGKRHANDAMRHYLWFVSFRIRDPIYIRKLKGFE